MLSLCKKRDSVKYVFTLLISDRISCIVHAGVPHEIIKRAAAVLDAVSKNNCVERLCNENISAQDDQYKVSFQFQESN